MVPRPTPAPMPTALWASSHLTTRADQHCSPQYLDLRLTFGPYSPAGGDASSTCSSSDSVFSHDPLPPRPSSFSFPGVQT